MKRSTRSAAIVLLIVAVVATPRTAWALAGSLDSPGVAFSQGYSENAKQAVMKALRNKECKFVRGSFINWHTSLEYVGDVAALNQFIEDLSKVPSTKVEVQFKRFENKSSWTVAHDADSNAFTIQVNLNSDKIQLERLVVPVVNHTKLRAQ